MPRVRSLRRSLASVSSSSGSPARVTRKRRMAASLVKPMPPTWTTTASTVAAGPVPTPSARSKQRRASTPPAFATALRPPLPAALLGEERFHLLSQEIAVEALPLREADDARGAMLGQRRGQRLCRRLVDGSLLVRLARLEGSREPSLLRERHQLAH